MYLHYMQYRINISLLKTDNVSSQGQYKVYIYTIKIKYSSLSVHHDLRTLIEAHVGITQQAAGKVRQSFVVSDCVEHLAALIPNPLHQVSTLNHSRDVIPMLLTCTVQGQSNF